MSQTQWVADQLLKYGKISRNKALKKYITRLAARINDLKQAGWKIDGYAVKTKDGRDYEYRLINIPAGMVY